MQVEDSCAAVYDDDAGVADDDAGFCGCHVGPQCLPPHTQ